MKTFLLRAVAACGAGLIAATPVFACTSFSIANNGRVLVGYNYDWHLGDGLMFVNKRGLSKTSTVGAPNTAASWISKYGSVTFNQYGRDNPMGGVNEAGLVVQQMWQDAVRYPGHDNRPATGVLEWMQLQLDTRASTAEVLAGIEQTRIASRIPLHYMVCDRAGECAALEWIDGRLIAMPGLNALTNDTVADSLNFARSLGDQPAPGGAGSLQRFARAQQAGAGFSASSAAEAVGKTFDTLDSLKQAGSTQWSIVYDLNEGQAHFRTRGNSAIKTLNFKSLDFGCATPTRVLDMNLAQVGAANPQLSDYTLQANRDLMQRSWRGTSFLKDIPQEVLEDEARHPERASCNASVLGASTAPAAITAPPRNGGPFPPWVYTPLGVAGVLVASALTLVLALWVMLRSAR